MSNRAGLLLDLDGHPLAVSDRAGLKVVSVSRAWLRHLCASETGGHMLAALLDLADGGLIEVVDDHEPTEARSGTLRAK